MSEPIIVAIDGPSGSGKSSTSRQVAQTLGFEYLDTGATYRALTWALLEAGVDVEDEQAVVEALPDVTIEVGTDPVAPTIFANGKDVSVPIRSEEVTTAVSPVSAVTKVREVLVALQREAISNASQGIVVEGRDIGTVVAPGAPAKVFLVADPLARAARRAAEVGADDAEAMRAALARRDQFDSTRQASPLAKADDAVQIDGTHLSLDEVVAVIVEKVKERLG